MSKNILIISSTPRKGGNSDLLCDEFMKGALERGNQIEKISLRDKNIHYCIGCGMCFNQQGNCSQNDDMAEISEKMIKADIIVLATPIYFYTMTGQLKTFLDRNCSFYTLLSKKEFYYIMTAADHNKSAMDKAIEEFRGYTRCLEGAEEKGIIYGTGAWNLGDIYGSAAMNEAFEMGKLI